MPHSNFKERFHLLGSGIGKCPCGQIFNFTSERDQEMKFQLHHKVCPKPVDSKQVPIPKKAMTLKEQQLDDAERKRKAYDNHQKYLSS